MDSWISEMQNIFRSGELDTEMQIMSDAIQVKAEVDPCYNARLIQTIFLFQLGYGAPGPYDGQTCAIDFC